MSLQSVLDKVSEVPGAGELIPVINPATEEQITEFRDGGAAAVDEAVARARASFRSGVWRNLPGRERARILWKVADLIEARGSELVQLDSLNNGMPFRSGEGILPSAAELFRYYAGWCTKVEGTSFDIQMTAGITGRQADLHGYTLKEPIGVVGMIFPWNGPLFNACIKLAPALAAGCSCVIKPAEETPLTAFVLDQILRDAGVPEGVVNLVFGYGHTAGAALAAHPDVDKVAFTGSTEVGKLIVQAASGNLKKVSLELGGKSPVLIFDDAAMRSATVSAAMGIFSGSGQGCVCGSRIFVQRGVFDQVVEGIAAVADKLRLGGPTDDGAQLGPLISKKQLTRVMGYVDEGKQEGVQVVTGGNRLDRKGYFVHPTVLTNVSTDARLYREEIFGPVVTVLPFEDEDEAVALANDTTYGLAGAVYTQNVRRAHRVARRIEAGTITLNCQLVYDHQMPFGGYKQSGWGREYARDGIEMYLETKSVYSQL
ncbi:aldehyde dehydrogenase family protein [Pseudofrankia inefficax]|uniref:Aldehyde Dehydrogenase n=1 Tax=Pseudofrankia inefficax (strain DSM 45817 / CECT 9037 / DDB 130130 / EuI1c) TaxID=298654 RepID=E3J814_PSEI1|nr:aldehyde dehydrogenase family protein [Pseudofrankia inefficax]ADP82062.1 Aldehyde Dehydrogenase [Pseudofrankia inefficax]